MVSDRVPRWRLWLRVLEGRHVRWRGVDSRLAIRLGRALQTGTPRQAAASPYYGEEFTFELQEPLEQLLDKKMVLSVQQARHLIPRNKVLASMEMELATVWAYPDHQVAHKWAVLWARDVEGPAGFLLVDVAILGPGDALRLPPGPVDSALLLQNLLSPSWAGPAPRTRATYLVRVFRADGLPLRRPAAQGATVYQHGETPPGAAGGAPRQDQGEGEGEDVAPTAGGGGAAEARSLDAAEAPRTDEQDTQAPALGPTPSMSAPAAPATPGLDRRPTRRGLFRAITLALGKMLCAPQRRARARDDALAKCRCKPQFSVRVLFAGQQGETSARGCDCRQPVWEEQLCFSDMYPPLHQRVQLQLLRGGKPVCVRRLQLDKICEDMPPEPPEAQWSGAGTGAGSLFGPWWVGLRTGTGAEGASSRRRRHPATWQGRLLVSLGVRCALHQDPHQGGHQGPRTRVLREPAPRISESGLWRRADVVLVAVLWDVFLLDRAMLAGKDLGFDLSLGSAGDRCLWQHPDSDVGARQLRHSSCSGLRAVCHDGAYLHVGLGRRKPVLAVRTLVPNTLRDLRSANALHRLSAALAEEERQVRRSVREGQRGGEVRLAAAVASALVGLGSLAALPTSSHGLKMMRQLVAVAQGLSEAMQSSRPSEAGAQDANGAQLAADCDRVRSLAQRMRRVADMADCGIGDAVLWLTCSRGRGGSKGGRRTRCAAVNLAPRHVLHARDASERGRHAGQLSTLALRAADGSTVAMVEVMCWLGNRQDAHLALQGLPGGHDGDLGQPGKLRLPDIVNYTEEHEYECWAHVWHGRFRPGADQSGLNDPYVRVVFGPHSAATQVVPGSLVPCWSRSLRLPVVKLCGDPADVRRRPPSVVVEAWDHDMFTNEFLGRALVRPRVVLPEVDSGPHAYPEPEAEAGRASVTGSGVEPESDAQSQQAGWHPRLARTWAKGLGEKWTHKWEQWRGPEWTHKWEQWRNPEWTHKWEQWQNPEWTHKWSPWKSKDGSRDGGQGRDPEAGLQAEGEVPQPSEEKDLERDSLQQVPEPEAQQSAERVQSQIQRSAPEFSGDVRWIALMSGSHRAGDVLAALQLIQVLPDAANATPRDEMSLMTPPERRYRLEVLFWGLRDVRPACAPGYQYVTIHIGSARLESCRLDPASSLNFQEPFASVDVDLPTDASLMPAVHVVLMHRGALSLFRRYAATHLLPSAARLLRADAPVWPWLPNSLMGVAPGAASQAEAPDHSELPGPRASRTPHASSSESVVIDLSASSSYNLVEDSRKAGKEPLLTRLGKAVPQRVRRLGGAAVEAVKMRVPREASKGPKGPKDAQEQPRTEDPDPDWWTRYYATVQAQDGGDGIMGSRVHEDFLLEVYPGELEAQPQFEAFQDFLRILPLCRGKREDASNDHHHDSDRATDLEDEEDVLEWDHPGKVMAELKVAMELQVLPDPTPAPRRPPQAPARPLGVLVRVYVVRAVALPPRDANASCDAYLVVKLGRQRRVDSGNVVKQNLNPIFGSVFEFETEFPPDHALTVRLMDWDAANRDDVIGETRIDLENRLFSRHMGGCGIPKRFTLKGNNRWRDSRLPSEILAGLALDYGLPTPSYDGLAVTVGSFTARAQDPPGGESAREHAALAALHAWHGACPDGKLVPQHVETRSLYHPQRPGIEQGQLEMWVDVLVRGRGMVPLPPALPLTPPSPARWELRVVVLEADAVVGTERLLLSKDKSSDVYVKGWMSGMESEAQSTDVHFACLSGAALWSWRMVFTFQHVWAENRILVEQGEGHGRHPPRLHLALMDYDIFTSDDLLGTLSLDLSRLPRGAAYASNCTAPGRTPGKDGKDPRPTVNLFLARHASGWWPALLATDEDKPRSKGLGGKLRLELSLMPASVADHDPAGRGREGPQALPKPQRPEDAISMLRHPLKGFYHFVWRRHRRWFVCALVTVLAVLFVLVALYSLPGHLVKKILNA